MSLESLHSGTYRVYGAQNVDPDEVVILDPIELE
jgi:hypothetical protein